MFSPSKGAAAAPPEGQCFGCFEDLSPDGPAASTTFACRECLARLCLECWLNYALMCSHEGRIPLLCPVTKCSSAVPPALIEALLRHPEVPKLETTVPEAPKAWDIYEDAQLNVALNADPTLRPRSCLACRQYTVLVSADSQALNSPKRGNDFGNGHAACSSETRAGTVSGAGGSGSNRGVAGVADGSGPPTPQQQQQPLKQPVQQPLQQQLQQQLQKRLQRHLPQQQQPQRHQQQQEHQPQAGVPSQHRQPPQELQQTRKPDSPGADARAPQQHQSQEQPHEPAHQPGPRAPCPQADLEHKIPPNILVCLNPQCGAASCLHCDVIVGHGENPSCQAPLGQVPSGPGIPGDGISGAAQQLEEPEIPPEECKVDEVAEQPGSSRPPGLPLLHPHLSRQASSHACQVPPHELLRKRILAAVDEGSCMRCPQCGRSGRKDSVAECSHIHCYCGTNWCYRCGRPEQELKGGFAGHNTGYNVLQDDRQCPLFLKQRYGVFFSSPDKLCSGEPDQALRFFHLDRQVKLLERLRQEVADDDLWTETFVRHFGCPQGTPPDRAARVLFDRNDLEDLEELNRSVNQFVDAKLGRLPKDSPLQRRQKFSQQAARLQQRVERRGGAFQ